MTEIATSFAVVATPDVIEHPIRRALRQTRVLIGGGLLLIIFGACVVTLPWTLRSGAALFYDNQYAYPSLTAPDAGQTCLWFGADQLGRPLIGRCLVGGAISLAI